ncbi:unnamed protein product [Echinostoma caproni]|uniref:Secreted protein n=1 Tax=Echinostoma caproni TaxID=27848 RepID=A0A183ABG8_9TREM|nr:unnamed protein product [Echinostoma caproni]
MQTLKLLLLVVTVSVTKAVLTDRTPVVESDKTVLNPLKAQLCTLFIMNNMKLLKEPEIFAMGKELKAAGQEDLRVYNI